MNYSLKFHYFFIKINIMFSIIKFFFKKKITLLFKYLFVFISILSYSAYFELRPSIIVEIEFKLYPNIHEEIKT
jgi:hypothetical protein